MAFTLSKTQRENGNVMTTNNQDIQKSNQPRNPSPVFLLLCREPAEIQLIIIASKLSEGEVKTEKSNLKILFPGEMKKLSS